MPDQESPSPSQPLILPEDLAAASAVLDYQDQAVKTAVYPPGQALIYPILGACGELMEELGPSLVVNVLPAMKHGVPTAMLDLELKNPKGMLEEVGDALWYLAASAQDAGVHLADPRAMTELRLELRAFDEPHFVPVRLLGHFTLACYHVGAASSFGKRRIRDNLPLAGEKFDKFLASLRSAFVHLCVVCRLLGGDYREVLGHNLAKLADRQARDKLHGQGDHR